MLVMLDKSLSSRATIVSSSVAFVLIVIKLVFGIMSGSVALLASAIDSILDFFISLFNFIAIKKSQEDPNKTFNFGKGKLESLAAFVEGVVIFISGLYVLFISTVKLFHPSPLEHIRIAILVMAISVLITFGLVVYLRQVYKKTKSIVIKTDSLHYQIDLYTNIAILVSLFFTSYFGLIFLDALLGLLIGIYIVYEATKVIKNSSLILLDHSLDKEIVSQIKEIFASHEDIADFHRFKTRTSGNINFVNVDIIFVDENISLLDAHSISDEIENDIMKLDKSIAWDVNIHLDPYDDL